MEQVHSERESEEDDDEVVSAPNGAGNDARNLGGILTSFYKKPAFQDRNSEAGLQTTLRNLEFEKRMTWTAKEKAMAWLVRRATLQGIPATFLDALLEPDNLNHLQELRGETMSKIKKNLDSKIYFLGHEISLKSGTKVTYVPITHSLQRSMLSKKAEKINETASTIPAEAMWKELESKGFFIDGRNQVSVLYWDPFRKWRSKGGSTGKKLEFPI